MAAAGASSGFEELKLPELPYKYDALEPHIDEGTMKLHHMAHHKGYTTKTNAALGTLAKLDADAAKKPIDEILQNLDKLPAEVQGPLRNAGGGYVNHALFWTVMGPGCGGDPAGPLGEAITARFGSVQKFREDFSAAAAKVFGSGWAWLYVDTTGETPKLEICATPNQDTPAMEAGKLPILGLDVWEHAYYKKYGPKRAEYIAAFWAVVNWEEVARRYEEASK